MKFIRNLVSRKQDPQGAPEAEAPDQIAPFVDVIGYGEDTVEEVEPETFDAEGTPAETADAPLLLQDPVQEARPADPPRPEGPKLHTTLDARNAYADAAFEESRDILDKLVAHLEDDGTQTAAQTAAPEEASEPAPETPDAQIRIWDLEDDNEAGDLPGALAQMQRVAAAPQDSAADVISMFGTSPEAPTAVQPPFPVGWMVVAGGPGRGTSFALEAGLSLIGRDADQAIRLNFGDTLVARSNHAAVVYDPETHAFTLGHGGKKDIVRLNGKPVISNEVLSMGDKIRIGDTTLHFVPLCSDSFDWAEEDDAREHEHVAIA